MANLPACPWCQAELLHTYKGQWRCPHCTGYFIIRKNGAVDRLYVPPTHPGIIAAMWVVFGAVMLAILIIIVAAVAGK